MEGVAIGVVTGTSNGDRAEVQRSLGSGLSARPLLQAWVQAADLGLSSRPPAPSPTRPPRPSPPGLKPRTSKSKAASSAALRGTRTSPGGNPAFAPERAASGRASLSVFGGIVSDSSSEVAQFKVYLKIAFKDFCQI